MSRRVSGWPVVRHNRWLSATAGAISALPVGYDHETRVLVGEVPGRQRLRTVEHGRRVQQHPIAGRGPSQRTDAVECQFAQARRDAARRAHAVEAGSDLERDRGLRCRRSRRHMLRREGRSCWPQAAAPVPRPSPRRWWPWLAAPSRWVCRAVQASRAPSSPHWHCTRQRASPGRLPRVPVVS